MVYKNYSKFIAECLKIIDKKGKEVPFVLNRAQDMFIEKATGRDIILKARQEGFSSLIGAIFMGDFLLKENSYSVVLADNADNAMGLLERVKFYLKSFEDITGQKIKLKYNSKYEMVNEIKNSRYQIGTAENTEFGRSKTITNLHMSECAFYPHFKKLLASALQAVTPEGRVALETTANGFNEFKEYWDSSVLNETGFNPIFFPASIMYDETFLVQKRKELDRMFVQEYPNTSEEAFLTSGDSYFNTEALTWYMAQTNNPISDYV
jgi:hypothetical protein